MKGRRLMVMQPVLVQLLLVQALVLWQICQLPLAIMPLQKQAKHGWFLLVLILTAVCWVQMPMVTVLVRSVKIL